MGRRFAAMLAIWLIILQGAPVPAAAAPPGDPAAFVSALLGASESLDFGEAKLAIGAFVEPATDIAAARGELDAMQATIGRMLGTLPGDLASTDLERFRALRAFLYEPGRWNGGRPFRYDVADRPGRLSRRNCCRHISRRGAAIASRCRSSSSSWASGSGST